MTRQDRLPRGEAHHNAKLTAAAVRSIRCRFTSGETIASIARTLGVVWKTVKLVLRRRTWRHVP
jgi:hypothetical protein